jgi:hypothetical protein
MNSAFITPKFFDAEADQLKAEAHRHEVMAEALRRQGGYARVIAMMLRSLSGQALADMRARIAMATDLDDARSQPLFSGGPGSVGGGSHAKGASRRRRMVPRPAGSPSTEAGR